MALNSGIFFSLRKCSTSNLNLREYELGRGTGELNYKMWQNTKHNRNVVMEIYSHLCQRSGKKPRRKGHLLFFPQKYIKLTFKSHLVLIFNFTKLFLTSISNKHKLSLRDIYLLLCKSSVFDISSLAVVGTCIEFVISLLSLLLLQGAGWKQKYQMAVGAQLCSSTNTS